MGQQHYVVLKDRFLSAEKNSGQMHTKLVGKFPFRGAAGLWDRVTSFCNGLIFIIILVLVI